MDRAKAAFQRAVDMDPENVEASLGLAVLEMSSLDMTVQDGREYRSKAERVMKMISMANMIDPSNAMVQNHLANHYFWKWSPVSVERGSWVIKGGGIGNALEVGDRVRIGDFETSVVGEDEGDGEEESVRIKDAWKGTSACE
jgi:RNA polymerase-associated protein CTR9